MTAEHDNWDRHWERYDEAVRRNPAQRMRHNLVVGLLRAGARPGMRVLDIGSGQGDLLVKLRPILPQAELAGFEMSASGVAISEKKLPGVKFLVADLFQPPAAAAPFTGWASDAVCSEVLEHVDSPVDFLRAARPYLADNARLIVTVPGGPMSAFDRHIGHRQHFTRESISRMLGEAGFAVERVQMSGWPFFNLYRLVVIARGRKLATDVDAGHGGASGWLAGVIMAVFRALFVFNLRNSPFGWQVVAVARKTGAN